jgi:hypothetical protein
VSLETLSHALLPGVERANGGPVVVSSFFFLLFSLFQLKYMPAPFSFLILVLMFYIFYFHP